MIRNTLSATKAATWSICLCSPEVGNLPTPTGTGFFVSPDGLMITAAHVVCDPNAGEPRNLDVVNGMLQRAPLPNETGKSTFPMLNGLSVKWFDLDEDIAIIEIDWNRPMSKMYKHIHGELSFLTVSTKMLDEGSPVYSFGYPLSEIRNVQWNGPGTSSSGESVICPRTTSAVVSSVQQGIPLMSRDDVLVYVLDKALNYGNSGGPIISTETGMVHAVCSRFHPVAIPQNHLPDQNNQPIPIVIPSLYGYSTSLANSDVLAQLKSLGVCISED